MIYLDNAATTSPKPQIVKNNITYAMNNLVANPGRGGHAPSVKAAEMVYSARGEAAQLFGLENPEGVMFTSHCTHAINTVLKGLSLRGKKVVVSSLEHNAVMRPVHQLERSGVKVEIAEVFFGDFNATLRSFERAIDTDTALVFCTHASNVNGAVLPIKEIGALCKGRGVLFGVDGAQTAGVFPINMKDMNIDFLCVPGHKGLYGPMGIGMLLSRNEIEYPLISGGTGSRSVEKEQPKDYPERLESGTLNVPGIAGLKGGIQFVKSKGIDIIRKHETSVSAYIYDNLAKMHHVTLYTPRPDGIHFAPVFSFNVKGMHSSETASRLNGGGIAVRAGLHCAPSAHRRMGTLESGTVRVSPSVFTTKNQADFFCQTIKNMKKDTIKY